MYKGIAETLACIDFTKIGEFLKNKNIFCAKGCEGMQEQVELLHPSASCYMPQKHENDFQLMEQLGVIRK
jgi:hypothetical protein